MPNRGTLISIETNSSRTSRVQTHSNPITDECCEAWSCEEVLSVFVISHGDAPKILEVPEHAFDGVSVQRHTGRRFFAGVP